MRIFATLCAGSVISLGVNFGASSTLSANACIQTHGSFGFTDEYDVERKFRDTRLYR